MQNCKIQDAVNTLRLYSEIKKSNERVDEIIQEIKLLNKKYNKNTKTKTKTKTKTI